MTETNQEATETNAPQERPRKDRGNNNPVQAAPAPAKPKSKYAEVVEEHLALYVKLMDQPFTTDATHVQAFGNLATAVRTILQYGEEDSMEVLLAFYKEHQNGLMHGSSRMRGYTNINPATATETLTVMELIQRIAEKDKLPLGRELIQRKLNRYGHADDLLVFHDKKNPS